MNRNPTPSELETEALDEQDSLRLWVHETGTHKERANVRKENQRLDRKKKPQPKRNDP